MRNLGGVGVVPVCMFILDAGRFWEFHTGGSSEARDGDEKEWQLLNGKLLRDIGKELVGMFAPE